MTCPTSELVVQRKVLNTSGFGPMGIRKVVLSCQACLRNPCSGWEAGREHSGSEAVAAGRERCLLHPAGCSSGTQKEEEPENWGFRSDMVGKKQIAIQRARLRGHPA